MASIPTEAAEVVTEVLSGLSLRPLDLKGVDGDDPKTPGKDHNLEIQEALPTESTSVRLLVDAAPGEVSSAPATTSSAHRDFAPISPPLMSLPNVPSDPYTPYTLLDVHQLAHSNLPYISSIARRATRQPAAVTTLSNPSDAPAAAHLVDTDLTPLFHGHVFASPCATLPSAEKMLAAFAVFSRNYVPEARRARAAWWWWPDEDDALDGDAPGDGPHEHEHEHEHAADPNHDMAAGEDEMAGEERWCCRARRAAVERRLRRDEIRQLHGMKVRGGTGGRRGGWDMDRVWQLWEEKQAEETLENEKLEKEKLEKEKQQAEADGALTAARAPGEKAPAKGAKRQKRAKAQGGQDTHDTHDGQDDGDRGDAPESHPVCRHMQLWHHPLPPCRRCERCYETLGLGTKEAKE